MVKNTEKSDNAADEKAVKDKTIKQRNKREQELKDLKEVLSTPEGQRVLWRLLKRFRLLNLSFTGNSETFFNEGRRNEGLWLLAQIAEADPQGAAKLFIQNSEDLKDYGGI